MNKANAVKCDECKFSIATNNNYRVFICDNPNLKTFCKNVKHGKNFSCGYGVLWDERELYSLDEIAASIREGGIPALRMMKE